MTMLAIVASSIVYMRVKMDNDQIFKYDVDNVEKTNYETDGTDRYMNVNTKTGNVDKYDVEKIVEVDYDIVPISGVKCGHEYIDLGLPSGMLWATYNVGATKSTEVGDYFAWGETTPKNRYNWSNYRWCSVDSTGALDKFSKYNKIDSMTVLVPEDDAATANWGYAWRMPTITETDELVNGCTWDWTKDFQGSKVAGMVGTSKTNGNIIFLPMSHSFSGDSLVIDKVDDGFFWSSTLSSVVNNNGNGYDHKKGEHSGSGYYYKFVKGHIEIAHINRCVGSSVRAVVSGDSCGFFPSYTVKFYGQDSTLIDSQIVRRGSDAIAPELPELKGYKTIGWSDSSFTYVLSDINVYAQYERLAICGHEYVDLGLPSGMLWATYNVGATKSTEVGDYFAWGETTPKNRYNWSNYRWCSVDSTGALDKFSKYNKIDSMTVLVPEDDAATANWGYAWRMPTITETDELVNGCTWDWTKDFQGSKVAGMVGTSKTNGNIIFLPMSHSFSGDSLVIDKVDDGFFWSSTLSSVVNNNGNGYDHKKGEHSGSGYYYKFVKGHIEIAHINRCFGAVVRAVVSGDSCGFFPSYKIKFYGKDSTLIDSQIVRRGSAATAPEIPELKGYKTIGWSDSSFTYVLSDINVYAKYERMAVCGHDVVDLGLPSGMLWATYNVGATKQTEVGDYFAWGETTPKKRYNWSTYRWCTVDSTGAFDKFTKYNNIDSTTVLDSEDDAATANWGNAWRMPTIKESDELVNGCTWDWTKDFQGSKVAGMVGTSKTNGNIIFLPMSHSFNGDSLIIDGVDDGYFWSSTLSTVVNNNGNGYDHKKGVHSGSGYYYKFIKGHIEIAHINRCFGAVVRAVVSGDSCGKVPSFYTVNFYGKDSTLIKKQIVREGTAAIDPKVPELKDHKFTGWSDTTYTNVKSDINAYAQYEKVAINGHEFVDLGLPNGTLWASRNVGAKTPTEIGDYFAWGETSPKPFYGLNTYKWCTVDSTGALDSLLKYNSTDSTIVLDSEDDAATANLGEGWRMPTMSEAEELVNGCDWNWTYDFQDTKVAGMVGTSKTNGKVIFLPMSHSMNGDSLVDKLDDGFIWTSNLSTIVNNNGNGYDDKKGEHSGSGFYYRYNITRDGHIEIAHVNRWIGAIVRGVANKNKAGHK